MKKNSSLLKIIFSSIIAISTSTLAQEPRVSMPSQDAFFNTTLSLFLENKNLLKNCKEDDCILGCFDLDYNLIEC